MCATYSRSAHTRSPSSGHAGQHGPHSAAAGRALVKPVPVGRMQ